MARLIFSNAKSFSDWISEHVKDTNYEAYETSSGEILLYPRKSTRPVTYAYMKVFKDNVADLKKQLTDKGVHVYQVERIEWADDRAVGTPSGGD